MIRICTGIPARTTKIYRFSMNKAAIIIYVVASASLLFLGLYLLYDGLTQCGCSFATAMKIWQSGAVLGIGLCVSVGVVLALIIEKVG